jgi:HEAT repeats
MALAGVFLASATLPSIVHAGPIGARVVPVYVMPPYYNRPYPPLYVDGAPVVSIPTPYQFGSLSFPLAQTQPSGTAITLPQVPAAQMNQPFGNAALGGFAPVVPAPAAAAADVDQVLQILSSPRERDRIEAAIILGRNKVAKAIEPLQRTLAGDTSPRAREAAARALGLLGDRSALKALDMAAQADDDRDVRHSAQFAAESIRTAGR